VIPPQEHHNGNSKGVDSLAATCEPLRTLNLRRIGIFFRDFERLNVRD